MQKPWISAVLVSLALGCGPRPSQVPVDAPLPPGNTVAQVAGETRPPSHQGGSPSLDSARQFLLRTLQHYQHMSQYADQLVLDVPASRPGVPPHRITLKTMFQRPQRLQFSVNDGDSEIRIMADEKQTVAQVLDPRHPRLSAQSVVRQTAGQLVVEDLIACGDYLDPTQPDHLSSFFLALPWDLQHIPWAWCSAEPKQLEAAVAEFLPLQDEVWDGRNCARYQLGHTPPTWIYWIDRQTERIVRIDRQGFDVDATSESPDGKERSPAVFAPLLVETQDLSQERWDPIPSVPSEGKLRYFVLEPNPLPFPDLGESLPPLTFQSMDGRASVKFEPGVCHVCIWFRDHPVCREFLGSMNPLAERLRSEQRIQFHAILTDPLDVLSEQACQTLVKQWSLTIPVVRDGSAVGRDKLQISQAPTCVVIDTAGRIAWWEVGGLGEISERLPSMLTRILAGDDVGGAMQDHARVQLAAFEQAVQRAQLPPTP